LRDARTGGGRVDEEVAHPHPSQTRMCRFPASGSSWESLARGGVDDTIRDSPAKRDSKVGSPPRFCPCQFSYPLSFRGQVCETQSSLPCFPSTVLSARHSSFLGRVPVGPVPRRQTSRHACPVAYLVRFRGPCDPPRFVSRRCAPGRMEEPSGPGSLLDRRPEMPVCTHMDVYGISQVPRRSILCLCPALR